MTSAPFGSASVSIRHLISSPVPSIVYKYRKYAGSRAQRVAVLEALDKSCAESSRARWQDELAKAYRERARDLTANARPFDPKYMDEFLKSARIGMVVPRYWYLRIIS